MCPSMVTARGKVLEILAITGLSFRPFFFSLPDLRDLIRDLGNCVLCSPSCLLAGSASGTQLTSGTLSPLSPHLSSLALTYLFGKEGKLK